MEFSHFRIRLLQMDDLDRYFRLVQENRARLEDFFTGTVSRTASYEDTRSFLAENLTKSAQRLYFPYIIEDTQTGDFPGFLDLKNIDWNIPKAELGCYTDYRYAGQGLTTQAFAHFVAHCFRQYGFTKLFLRTHPGNTAARRLAESAGFEVEGTLRREYRTTRGEVVDLVYYGKLAD